MNLHHVHEFTAAMRRKDLEAMLSHMSDRISLRTPLVREPFRGKAAIRPVVRALLDVVEGFDFLEVMQGPGHVSSFFKVRVRDTELDGMDYWRLDEAGLIEEMTVLWRPLPGVARVNEILLAAKGGSQARVDAR